MTQEEINNLLVQLQRQILELQQLIRRHKHDDIETDKLPFSSFKDWGASKEHWVLTSRGATLPPDWDLTGVSVSASASVSRSPSASLSPSSSTSA
jgi:hypothetical protein